MRYYLFLFFLTFIAFGVARGQNANSGEVIYYLKTIEPETEDFRLKFILNRFPHIRSVSDSLIFKLLFNPTTCHFYSDDSRIVNVDRTQLLAAKAFVGAERTYWQDTTFSYMLTKDGIARQSKDVLQYEEKGKSLWHFPGDSKLIGEYLCFKAIRNEAAIGGNQSAMPIIAWFCPEIPLPFGPLNYGNLPGLILELQTENAVFGVRNIIFEHIQVPTIPDLPRFTAAELKKKLEESVLDRLK